MNSPAFTEQSLFNVFDILVIAVYVASVYTIALLVRRHQNTDDDYYLAGRNTHWFFIAVSTFATLFSTISFVTIPAEAFENGLQLSLSIFLGLPLLPLAAHLMLRFFFISPTFTAYEYLEHRFNLPCRLAGASFFIMSRLMYTAVILYAASVVFHSIFGIPTIAVIIIIGLGTLIYTFIGGMRAVIFTDFLQSIMLITGIVGIVYFISKGIGFDWIGQYKALAAENEKYTYSFLTKPDFYKPGYQDRVNILLLIFLFWHQPFMQVSSDQLVIQRMLSSRGYKESLKAIYTNICLALPIVILVWIIGVGLAIFYRSNHLPEGIPSKDVLGYFIRTQLPSPIPGIICAAMLAMIMSTIDSTINSLSAVMQHDILMNTPWKLLAKTSILKARLMSLAWGFIGISMAVIVQMFGKSGKMPIIELSSVLMSGWAILTITFCLGVLTSWVRPRAMMTGMILGGIALLIGQWGLYMGQPPENRIGFGYISLIALFVTFTTSILLSLIDPKPYTAPPGTCLKSLNKHPDLSQNQPPQEEQNIVS
jgi:SSS family transporter